MPLRHRLPLAFSAVLLLVVAAATGIGWRGVRTAAFQAISDRLDGAVGRLANLFSESPRAIRNDLTRLAADPAILHFVTTGAQPADVDRVLSEHDHGGTLLAAEIRSATGGRLRIRGADTMVASMVTGWPSEGADLSGFMGWDTVVVVAGTAPILRGTDSVGFVVEWRRLGSGGNFLALIQDLIGRDARFLIGVPGHSWTDLSAVLPGPDVQLHHGVTLHAVVPGDGALVGQARQLDQGPWWVWVGFPEGYVYDGSATFLGVMMIVGLVLVTLGGWLGWRVSLSLTEPLAALATTADTIASGALETRAVVVGDVELRQLAGAFNRMAERVEAAHQRLEQRVVERTAELHAAQEQLVRRERLAILGQLASGVGHELRNPLGVMNNAVYFLNATMKDAPPKITEYLGILQHQIVLSERIVSDLLDFARIRAPQRETVLLREIVEAQLARADLPGTVVVERRYPSGRLPVPLDVVQVGQVILNLIVNAAQAMEGGGRLTLAIEPNDAGVRLRVTDTGPGVAPEHQAQIFEPLFTTKARGIGLGLAVSRGLAEANGGRLDLAATGPEGTTFTLDLPSGSVA